MNLTNLILKDLISIQANEMPNGWLELDVEGSEEFKIKPFKLKLPKAPFMSWVYGARFTSNGDWVNICPVGMKMQMDDPNHSDWWLMTGIPIDLAYSYGKRMSKFSKKLIKKAELIEQAAWDFRVNHEEKREKNSIFLVSSNKEILGTVFFVKNKEDVFSFVDEVKRWNQKNVYNKQNFVAVIPNCSVEYDLVIKYASAIITEIGSAAAHVVKIAREDSVPVILCTTAFDSYVNGEEIKIKNKDISSNR